MKLTPSIVCCLLFLSALAAPASAQTAGTVSTLIILSQQAPNATAWVLAPLEQPIPTDIRQNLTLLREDLLDEGKLRPVTNLDVYRSGHQVCSSILAALDERDAAVVQSGLTAAQANARIPVGVSTQGLEARRSYLYSWPQYDREMVQREDLKQQAQNNAAVMKELPKVEWQRKSRKLRSDIDAQYGSLRAAMRNSQVPGLMDAAPVSAPVAAASAAPAADPASVPAALPSSDQTLFVDKSWYSRAGSEYHFNKDGTGHRFQKMDFDENVAFTWTQRADGLVEVRQRKQPAAPASSAYFRFVDSQTAFLGDSLGNINSQIKPSKP